MGSFAWGSARALSFASCETSRRVATTVSVNVGGSLTPFASTMAFASFGAAAGMGLFGCSSGFATAAGCVLVLGMVAKMEEGACLGAGGGTTGSGTSSLSTETWLRSDDGRAGANFLKRS